MHRNEVEAVLTLAGVNYDRIVEIENRYWPDTPNYRSARLNSPWYRVSSNFGDFVIGRRKRVFEVNWIDTNKRGIVTEDDVSKNDHMVHAWDILALIRYMTVWKGLPTVPADMMYVKEHYASGKKDVLDVLSCVRFDDSLDPDTRPEIKKVIELVESLPDDFPISITHRDLTERRAYHVKFGKVTVQIHP